MLQAGFAVWPGRILKRFLVSRRTGLYVAVEHEGEVEAGETFPLLSRDNHRVTVADITRVYAHEKDDVATMQRLVQLPYLSAPWREYFQSNCTSVGSPSRARGLAQSGARGRS